MPLAVFIEVERFFKSKSLVCSSLNSQVREVSFLGLRFFMVFRSILVLYLMILRGEVFSVVDWEIWVIGIGSFGRVIKGRKEGEGVR